MTMEPLTQPQRIVLFGDQTENVLPAIKTLYKRAPSSIYIQHFLRVSIGAARRSLEQQCTGSERSKFYFDSFLTLAEESTQRQCPDVVVQTLLLCVAQLGHLVLYVHQAREKVMHQLIRRKQETRRRPRVSAKLDFRGLVYRSSACCRGRLFTIPGSSPSTLS